MFMITATDRVWSLVNYFIGPGLELMRPFADNELTVCNHCFIWHAMEVLQALVIKFIWTTFFFSLIPNRLYDTPYSYRALISARNEIISAIMFQWPTKMWTGRERGFIGSCD